MSIKSNSIFLHTHEWQCQKSLRSKNKNRNVSWHLKLGTKILVVCEISSPYYKNFIPTERISSPNPIYNTMSSKTIPRSSARFILFFFLSLITNGQAVDFHVKRYGARANGNSDDSQVKNQAFTYHLIIVSLSRSTLSCWHMRHIFT